MLQYGPSCLRFDHLDECDAVPTGLKLLGRAGAYAPLFLFPNPPLSFVFFDLYLYSEGTQASTLWRVSSSLLVSFPFVLVFLPLCLTISDDSHSRC